MERKWWKEGIIYQIYPQSFFDSNGDGIGDLQGIISKLDYVKSLGVDIIWLNPIYDSPLDDNGYDIRDYRKLNPIYGTMEDFEELLENVHYRGMRLIMDLVVNHSSDEHEWFVNSRKSKDNPYRDYYFWRPGKDGGEPNNWISVFSGSAWEYDAHTDEYYLHLFTKKQPDLNWENPQVRNEIYNLVNWWLDKGIDGFRLDVISMISKETHFPDADTEHFEEMMTWYYCNGPRVHEFIHEMHERTFKHYNIMTVGEGPGITKDIGNLYTGKDRGELDMIFPLDLMFADWGPGGKYDFGTLDLRRVKQYFSEWAEELGDNGWMSIFLDNHDFARMVSRFGDDGEFREASAKCLLTMILTLRGTPSIHYGSENIRRLRTGDIIPIAINLVPIKGSIYINLTDIPRNIDSVFVAFITTDTTYVVKSKRSGIVFLSIDNVPDQTEGSLIIDGISLDCSASISDTIDFTFSSTTNQNIDAQFFAPSATFTLSIAIPSPSTTVISGNASTYQYPESGPLAIVEMLVYGENESDYISIENTSDSSFYTDTLILTISGPSGKEELIIEDVSIAPHAHFTIGGENATASDITTSLSLPTTSRTIEIHTSDNAILDRLSYTMGDQDWPSASKNIPIRCTQEDDPVNANNFGENWILVE